MKRIGLQARRFPLVSLFMLLALFSLSIFAGKSYERTRNRKSNNKSIERAVHAKFGFDRRDGRHALEGQTTAEPAQSNERFSIARSVVAGGGGSASGGGQNLAGTAGQAATATSTGGSYSLSSGFWGAARTCQAIAVNPATLPDGAPGVAYSQTFTQTGGSGAITWNLTGTLPGGLSFNAALATLLGTPSQSGNFNFRVKAADAGGCSGERDYTLAIACPAIAISPATLPDGVSGNAYSQTLAASGGVRPYVFSLSAGALPAGMNLSPAGVLSGSPTASGQFTFTVKAKDANNCEGARNYTLVVNPPAAGRTVRVVAASGSPGGTVVVPIELASQGDENAVGLSLTFDTSVLSNPSLALGGDAAGAAPNFNLSQVASGRVGLALSLPSGQVFAAGARRIFNVTFTIAGGLAVNLTDINCGDQPIAREVVSAAATPLSAAFIGGAVTITSGFEADVAPRPDGNGTVTVSDWVQVGRFAAGMDTAAPGGEFQRADCAPRDTRGNGAISLADWVQAGRYAGGLDEVVASGGPTAPNSLLPDSGGESVLTHSQAAAQRRAVRAQVAAGAPGGVVLMLDALGDENALGFSLLFNPSHWRFVSAASGSDAGDALLNTNLQASRGRLGVVMALPASRTFAAGARQVAVLTFEPVAGGGVSSGLAVGFADAPVPREVVAADVRALVADYSVELGGALSFLTSVSAASFRGGEVAREQIVAAFGPNLAAGAAVADALPLPTDLAGTRVTVTDSAGASRVAPLFFVSPTQINYQFPAGTADGSATVTVTRGGVASSIGLVSAGAVAPALFTADASGRGLPAGSVLRVSGAGALSYEPLSRYDGATGRVVAVPVDLGASDDQVFLVLYGTGVRGRSNLANVACAVGGVAAEVSYAGEAAGFAGLDQINIRLPRSLAGRGDVELVLRADGKAANTVTVRIR